MQFCLGCGNAKEQPGEKLGCMSLHHTLCWTHQLESTGIWPVGALVDILFLTVRRVALNGHGLQT